VLPFNPKAFNHIDFTQFKFNCFYFTFVNHSHLNSSLLHVFAHNVMIHIQWSIIHFVPWGYNTRLIVYITYVLSIRLITNTNTSLYQKYQGSSPRNPTTSTAILFCHYTFPPPNHFFSPNL